MSGNLLQELLRARRVLEEASRPWNEKIASAEQTLTKTKEDAQKAIEVAEKSLQGIYGDKSKATDGLENSFLLLKRRLRELPIAEAISLAPEERRPVMVSISWETGFGKRDGAFLFIHPANPTLAIICIDAEYRGPKTGGHYYRLELCEGVRTREFQGFCTCESCCPCGISGEHETEKFFVAIRDICKAHGITEIFIEGFRNDGSFDEGVWQFTENGFKVCKNESARALPGLIYEFK